MNGNLLDANAAALVNAVNCVGVMGKGLALQFKNRFPAGYFQAYKRACQNGTLRIGRVHVYRLDSEHDPRFVVDIPTQNHWREKSRLEDITNLPKYQIETKNNSVSSMFRLISWQNEMKENK
ncbi:MAG: macro domain-containing protein [Acidobacteria bacterium]|nr:macro domain-containing protein [Acidobacteriota bacterium]